MTVLFLMTVISAAAVTFFVCFYSAIRHEVPSAPAVGCLGPNDPAAHTCRVVRISSSSPIQRTGEVSPLRATSTMLLHRTSAVLRSPTS